MSGKGKGKRKKSKGKNEDSCAMCFIEFNSECGWIQCDTCDNWICETCAGIDNWDHYSHDDVQFTCLLCK